MNLNNNKEALYFGVTDAEKIKGKRWLINEGKNIERRIEERKNFIWLRCRHCSSCEETWPQMVFGFLICSPRWVVGLSEWSLELARCALLGH